MIVDNRQASLGCPTIRTLVFGFVCCKPIALASHRHGSAGNEFRCLRSWRSLISIGFVSIALFGGLIYPLRVLAAEVRLTSEVVAPQPRESYVIRTAREFAESDIEFTRSVSNVPMPPLAYLGSTYYGEAVVVDPESGQQLENYSLQSTTQAAGVPFLLSQTDALIIGEYVSHSRFDVGDGEDFSMTSVGVATAWMTQYSDDVQLAAFVMPVWHTSTLDNGSDYWQTMGGAFARYTASTKTWWAFGLFADSSKFNSYVLPYVGASWQLSPEWSISAIMPWPAINYAPNKDELYSFGATFSGAAWAVDRETGEAAMDLSAFDFGFSGERRLVGALWAGFSVGVGGLRALAIYEGDVEMPSMDVTHSPYFNINLTLRPDALL